MGIERAIFKGTLLNTVQVRNMFTANITEVGGDTSAVLWNTYNLAILADIGDLTGQSMHWYEAEIQTYSAGHWTTNDVVAFDFGGSVTGDLLPYQAAITFIAKGAGLRQVGRKFIGGVTETMTAGGVLSGTLVTAAAQFLTDWIAPVTGIGGGTLQPGIVDKTGTFRAFVGGTVSSVLGSMRRRKPGVGI